MVEADIIWGAVVEETLEEGIPEAVEVLVVEVPEVEVLVEDL
jgi:hypothetical protein